MKEHTPETQPMSDDTKTIITVLTLISIPPVGVVLMWIWNKWQTWVKLVVTGCTCLPFILILIAFALGFFGTIMSEVDKELKMTGDQFSDLPDVSIIREDSIKTNIQNQNGSINVFNDVAAGYSVTYDGNKFTSCNPSNTFQKELILWSLPTECSVGDVPYVFKVSKKTFEYDSIDPIEEQIMVDGVKAIQKTYNFTEADGPLYELGQLKVIDVKSPKKANITIQMTGSVSELLAGFKWN